MALTLQVIYNVIQSYRGKKKCKKLVVNYGISVADPGFSPGGGAPTPKIAIIF